MLDFSAYNIRKFEVKIGEKTLNILPPKLNQVNKINEFTGKLYTKGVSSEEMADAALLILNRNDNSEKFDKDFIMELEYDIIYSTVVGYIVWVKEIDKNPNFYSLPAQQ